nr:GA-binding protein subunit beta-1-like [Leptinotarsa decemlineata]XP_023012761.1 GA-binding protein subunit beta-1-like [Leptinotarsa decemlineata]
MIKFGGGVVEDGQSVQRAKYIISAVSNNNTDTITLNGAELIPIDWEGRLVTHTSVSVNELGKQLLKAALDGDVDQVKNLLTKGAPFTADWLGTSPLHLAAQNNHLEITEILLRAGISKDARTKVDRTPLHMAAYEGHLQIVDALTKNGADIDCKDLLGMTPLHWAVQNGHLEVAAHLLRNGALINEVNKFDLTPLHIAKQINRPDIEKLLTESIVDTSVATQNLVLQLASDEGSENQVQEFSDEMELENNENSSPVFGSYSVDSKVLQELENSANGLDESSQNGSESHQIEEETDQERIEKENEQLVQHVTVDPSTFTTESLKILQEHGITMLQNDENDDSNILHSVMENGHSVVLTDIGKEVLNSVKQSEQQQKQKQQKQQQPPVLKMNKKVVTITPEQFLAMTNNKNIFNQLKVVPSRGPIKRVVMRKNKLIPISSSKTPLSTFTPVSTVTRISGDAVMIGQADKPSQNDMESVMNQLIEAQNTIEEYKIKLRRKEQEVEKYKMQIKLLTGTS